MPRKNLARRFDPRGGVSEVMLDAETVYLGREIEDYLLLSFDDLREMLATRRKMLEEIQQELQPLIDGLAERTQLAVLCGLYRDFHHMAALYRTYLRSIDGIEANGDVPHVRQPAAPAPLPFREWLFGEA